MIKYTNDFLIQELKNYYNETGYIPIGKKFHIAMNTYSRRFGSWSNALSIAGIPHRNTKYKFKCKECSEIFYKPKYTKRKFCSKKCSAIYNNKLRKADKCMFCDKFVPKGYKYCNHEHHLEYQYLYKIKPKIERGEIAERKTLKRYLTKERGYTCEKCNINTWKEQPLPLEIDHINGDASNNFPSNIRLLCPNCHSITSTWKGRNKGHGRKSRGLSL